MATVGECRQPIGVDSARSRIRANKSISYSSSFVCVSMLLLSPFPLRWILLVRGGSLARSTSQTWRVLRKNSRVCPGPGSNRIESNRIESKRKTLLGTSLFLRSSIGQRWSWFRRCTPLGLVKRRLCLAHTQPDLTGPVKYGSTIGQHGRVAPQREKQTERQSNGPSLGTFDPLFLTKLLANSIFFFVK